MNLSKKTRGEAVIRYFLAHQPTPTTELKYRSEFELLVAVVLSAQCTDKRINEVTPALFECFPTPELMAGALFEEVYDLIRRVSYPRNKAKYVIALSSLLVEKHEGKVPSEVNALQKLPGVGRKTAHVVAATLFGKATLGVDTHVFRVARRLGLASPHAKTPLAVERELVHHLPEKHLGKINHWLVLHGRYVCKARLPLCEKCPFTSFCAYFTKPSIFKKSTYFFDK